MKIHIIGSAGSGKSYGAKKLSKLLKIPHYDLDDIYWHKKDTDYTLKEDLAKVKKELNRIVKGKDWVIEGAYSAWTDASFKRADIIIILKPHRYIRTLRLIKRTIKGRLGIIKRKRETLKEIFEFLRFNHMWEKNKLLTLEERLEKHRKKVYYFNLADDAIKYVMSKKGL